MADNDQQRIGLLSKLRDPYGRLPNIILDFYGPAMKQAGWLYCLLIRFSKFDDSTTFVGLKTLEETSGVDIKTIIRYTEHLENIGVIEVSRDKNFREEKRRAKSNVYVLGLPPLPPPPEIIAKYFPKNWTPPERALKALKNISNYLDFAPGPQEKDTKGGDTGTLPVTPTQQEKTPPGVSGTTPVTQEILEGKTARDSGAMPDTPRQDASKSLAPRQTNKLLLTRDIQQEETTGTSKQEAFVCDEAFINQFVTEARTIDKTIGRDQLRPFINQAAKKENFEKEKVQDRLWKALQAGVEYRLKGGHISDFRRWLMTAVVQGFSPNAQVREQEDQAELNSEFEDNSVLSAEDILFNFDMAITRLGPAEALRQYQEKLKNHPDWEKTEKEIILKHKLKIVEGVADYKTFNEYTFDDILDTYQRCAFMGAHAKRMGILTTQFSNNTNWEKAKEALDQLHTNTEKGDLG